MHPKGVCDKVVSEVSHDIPTITSMLQENSDCIEAIFEYIVKLGLKIAGFRTPVIEDTDSKYPDYPVSMKDFVCHESERLSIIRDMLHDINEVL